MKKEIIKYLVEKGLKHEVNQACTFFWYQDRIPLKATQRFKKKQHK